MAHTGLAAARDQIPVCSQKYVLIPVTIRAHGSSDFIRNKFNSVKFQIEQSIMLGTRNQHGEGLVRRCH